jgi:predicted N-acetyltransferase YhbS
MGAIDAPVSDGVTLRAMTPADLGAAQALTAEQRWPHRPADWEQAFRHGEGFVAERDGQVVGTGMRWRWGPRHATVGLIVVGRHLDAL